MSTIRFANLRDGWAFGPQLWSTHDGGKTWRNIGESAAVSDVEASDGRAYAIVGSQLLRTPAGSDSWTAVPGAPQGGRSIALHGGAVWITTGSGQLATSTDGATWRTLNSACGSAGTQWQLAGVAPVDASRVYLLCAGGVGAGNEDKKVLYSTDGGVHATPTNVDPPRGGDINGFAAASPTIVAVSARSGASFVYRSGDAGHSWQTVLQQGDGGVGYFDLGFTTSSQGVVVYGRPGTGVTTTLLMTHDGGASWAPVTF